MAYALTSKNYFGNLFQWRNATKPGVRHGLQIIGISEIRYAHG
jgi:hypothetical protein